MRTSDVLQFLRGTMLCVVSLPMTMYSQVAAALDLGYRLELGAASTDNIKRDDNDAQSEGIGSAGVRFSAEQKSRLLQADLAGTFEYLSYFDNTYDDELVGNFAGIGRVSFSPQRFEWLFQDNFGQVRRNAFETVTPQNRENINYATTGPDFTFGGDVARVRVSGRYSRVSFETTPADNERVQGMLAVVHSLSEMSSISLNVGVESVTFDTAATIGDYDRREAFARLAGGWHRTTWTMDLGYADLDSGQPTRSNWLLRANLSRKISRSSTLSLAAGREFTDAAGIFRLEQNIGGIGLGTDTVQQTGNPFLNEFVTLGWGFQRDRTQWHLSLAGFSENYQDPVTPDRRRAVIEGRWHHDLALSCSLELFTNYDREYFDGFNPDYHENGSGVLLSWRLGRTLSTNIEYDRYTRGSDAPADDYAENRFWLRFSWGSGTLRSRLTALPDLVGSPY